MGNAQVPKCAEPRLLLSEYNDLAYQEGDMLASYKLFKVMKCCHDREGWVLVKLFIKRDGAPNLKEMRERILEVKDAFRSHWLHPNVVPYQGLEIGSQSAILLRPHFAHSLYDRMHMRPFLSECSKNWIAFQILCAVCQAHSVGVAHGDLKTENVFVSSWNHVMLSDFATFKPLVLPRDDTSEFSFFFESNLIRRRCYLAPERFDTPASSSSLGRSRRGDAAEPKADGEPARSEMEELAASDVFSLGCVLAELFLDGQTLMDLPALLKYRSAQLDLTAKIAGIKNRGVQEILGSMLSREPGQRKAASSYLRDWCVRVAPRSFRSCLFPLAVVLLHPVYQHPDMRVALLRHNFAGLLWSTVGPAKLGDLLGLPAGTDAAATWEAWRRHVERQARPLDAVSMHGIVHAAAVAASHRAEHLGGRPEADRPGPTDDDRPRGGPSPGPAHTGGFAPTLAQPWFREDVCETFTASLMDYWETGCHRCAGPGQGAGEAQAKALQEGLASGIYGSFLNALCGHGGEAPDAEPPGPGAVADPLLAQLGAAAGGDPSWRAGSGDDEVVEILCSIVCSALQHLGSPRMRLICLDMLTQMAPFAPQSAILEEIVPYCHTLMTDKVAQVRARAIESLPSVLARVDELPPSDTGLFLDYLFPQLPSAMSHMGTEMGTEPVVLLAVARNIGALAQHALRLAERIADAPPRLGSSSSGVGEQEPVERGTSEQFGSPLRLPAAALIEATSAAAEAEPYDVVCHRIREAVKHVVKALLEYGGVGQENTLQAVAIGKEVKIALLRSMCVLSETFGRDGTHNFLLPYLISFMNDPAWEVRAAFCEEAAALPKRVGQVSTEGIIWPCYEQALMDQEERVLQAALGGLSTLVAQRVLRRQSLTNVALKVASMLLHPSAVVRERTVDVLKALGEQLTPVDQCVFLMPTIRPFLQFELFGVESLDGALMPPLSRRTFKRALLRRDEELHKALLQRAPLPGVAPGEWAEGDAEALELMRPYLQMMLGSRSPQGQGASMGQDDGNGCALAPEVHTLDYPAVNPRCLPNRSLQAIAESDDIGCEWPFASVHSMRHPLSLFSMRAFLTKALCLPPRPRDMGSLNHLDGTPYSVYAEEDKRSPLGVALDLPDAEPEGLERSMKGSGSDWPRRGRSDDAMGALVTEIEASARLGASRVPASRPQGALLSTLYEYAHQGGMHVVKVDVTDDSRTLVTGGREGLVKVWNCARLERDVAVASSHSFLVPASSPGVRQRLRALRTVRNSKAVAVGSECGDVLVYRVDSRGSTDAPQVCRAVGERPSGSAVMCIEQFDTELESLIVLARQNGALEGWDLRRDSPSWSVKKVPPWLGVPSCVALGHDAHSMVVGTLGGGLLVYDLRFLAPWKCWRVASGSAMLAMRTASVGSSPSVFAAMESEANEVALFDVVQGSCSKVFLTEAVSERQRGAGFAGVPVLRPAEPHAGVPEPLFSGPAAARCSTSSVRTLWLPPRGPQSFLLAGGADRKVRHWSLDPEHHTSEAYVVTPPDPMSPREKGGCKTASYSASCVDNAVVVQEQTDFLPQRAEGPSRGTSPPPVGRGPNPNHRDAILDMCMVTLESHFLVTAGRDGLVKLWR